MYFYGFHLLLYKLIGIVYLLFQMTDIKCSSHTASQDFTEACKVHQCLKDMAQQTRDDPTRLLAQATSRLPVEQD